MRNLVSYFFSGLATKCFRSCSKAHEEEAGEGKVTQTMEIGVSILV
jgi:hypothetical protein